MFNVKDNTRPWKVVGQLTGAVMGQFADKRKAQAYAKELQQIGARKMRVEYRKD